MIYFAFAVGFASFGAVGCVAAWKVSALLERYGELLFAKTSGDLVVMDLPETEARPIDHEKVNAQWL